MNRSVRITRQERLSRCTEITKKKRERHESAVLNNFRKESLQINMDAVHTCETCKIKYACGELVLSFIEGFIELRAIQKYLFSFIFLMFSSVKVFRI